jgi:hypothetical protein
MRRRATLGTGTSVVGMNSAVKADIIASRIVVA